MPRTSHTIVALAVAAFGLGMTPAAHAQTAFSIANNGNRLISFDLATPGTVTAIGNIHGAVSSLQGLDFRPSDGVLYGYDNVSGSIVTVNTTNGNTKFVSNLTNTPTTTNLGSVNI